MFNSLEANARRRRYRLLASFLHSLPKPPAILDVGGTMDYWNTVGLSSAAVRHLVLFNTFQQTVGSPFESVIGDARDLSRYAVREFDIVFSNSVIGHVGGFAEQMQMASEIRRVGKYFLVQTPNHGFPIDWRTLVPFFHLLPACCQAWCFERVAVGRYPRATTREEAEHWATRVRNIRRNELSQLFPGGTVVEERVYGLTKSFVVHNLPVLRSDLSPKNRIPC